MPLFKTELDPEYLGSPQKTETGNMYPNSGVCMGDDGVLYAAFAESRGTGNEAAHVVRLSDGTTFARMTVTDLDAAILAEFGLVHTFSNSVNGGAVGDGVHFWAFAWDLDGINSCAVAFWFVNSSGNVQLRSAHLTRGPSTANIDDGDIFCCGLMYGHFVMLANDGSGRGIIMPGPLMTSLNEYPAVASPSPWTSRSVSLIPTGSTILEKGVSNEDTYRNAGGRRSSALWIADNTLYGMWTKNDCDYEAAAPGTSAEPLGIEFANYPDGFIAKFDVQIVDIADYPSLQLNGYTIDNDNWGDFPFDDSGLNRAGNSDTDDDYWRQPTVVPMGGSSVIFFLKSFDGSEDCAPTGTYFKVVGYYGSSSAGWQRVVSFEGNGYDTVAEFGQTEGTRYDVGAASAGALWKPEDGVLYVFEGIGLGGTSDITKDNAWTISRLGTLIVKKAGVILNVN